MGAVAGKLTVVGTPIGNLGDLSPRAAQALASADVVCCEDTRVTGRLLAATGASARLMRCDENVIAERAPQLVERMLAGETVAFASDAGMPGVSDPGQRLVDAARAAGVDVEVVPGPVLFYESPHRVLACLESVARVFPDREAALARELTKVHEEVVRDLAPALVERLRARESLKGEMVVVVAPPSEEELALVARRAAVPAGDEGSADDLLREAVVEALAAGEGARSIAKRLSTRFSRRKREVYELAVSLQDDPSLR